ncbi:MAG: spore coat protein CotJB [Clostridia bacterium]|nr:spore coat protein CotJB [Clostridia bacterium]
MNQQNRSCKTQLETLRALDFAIVETALYLDVYPQCAEALEYYHALIAQRETVAAAYEKGCGPLTIYGNRSLNSWDWVNTPWPWEADAN